MSETKAEIVLGRIVVFPHLNDKGEIEFTNYLPDSAIIALAQLTREHPDASWRVVSGLPDNKIDKPVSLLVKLHD